MRTVKFRGVTPKGETVYGDLTHYNGHCFVADKRVVEDSVAQFCGLDLAGEEVYEGDKVVAYGKEYNVRLLPNYGLFKHLNRCILKQ